MDILKKPKSAQIAYSHGLWAPGCLEIERLDSGRLGPKKWKLNFIFEGGVAYYDIFNSGS